MARKIYNKIDISKNNNDSFSVVADGQALFTGSFDNCCKWLDNARFSENAFLGVRARPLTEAEKNYTPTIDDAALAWCCGCRGWDCL